MKWTVDSIPDQTGRVAIVTGANSGIGLETARALTQKGATVVLACRNRTKGEAAVTSIMNANPAGTALLIQLDLADLESIETFVMAFRENFDRLDLLINNAGVMFPDESKTAQGFELQFGTNHLGHFALTGHLLPMLEKTDGARVVVVSSTAHRAGKIDFDDLQWESRTYRKIPSYCQSKLANLLFAFELQRRLEARGSQVVVTGAHPGWTLTDLQRHWGLVRFFSQFFGQSSADGALPTLRAATDPDAGKASYWGPANLMEMRGAPVPAKIDKRAQNRTVAAQLFDISEQLTDVRYPA